MSLMGLLRHLPPTDVRPILACPPGGHPPEALGQAEVVEVPALDPKWTLNPVHQIRQYRRLRQAARALRDVAESHHVDLIHANSWPAAAAAARAGLDGIPILWHVRELLIRPPITSWLRSRCAAAIAISGAVKDLLLRRGYAAERVHLVYNGIDADEFRPARPAGEVRAELGVDPQSPLVCAVGWLVPWKRHELMLEAARLVHDEVPQARFLFLGAEPERHKGRLGRLRALAARTGLADAVTFTGHRQDVADILNACDVFFHGAELEPFGRAVLEAMLLGKPAVVANSAGPGEQVENEISGLTVTPGDPQALADGVLRMLREPQFAARCGENARRRAEANFSAQKMADETLAVYHHILETPAA